MGNKYILIVVAAEALNFIVKQKFFCICFLHNGAIIIY